MTWILFLIVTAVIIFAGTVLARYGDILAEKTGMGRSWIGLVLVAATTSLPELFTGFSSTAIFKLPDIAVGDVLGSCMFNLLILSLMDAVAGKESISARAQQGHSLSIGFGLLLVGFAGLGSLAGTRLPSLGWIGIYTPLLIIGYLAAMRLIFLFEQRRLAKEAKLIAVELQYANISLRKAVTRYIYAAVVVVFAATFLPNLGERIAQETGLGQAFVGTLFIALATSLPEVVVSLSAVRLGALDLGIGNILGSNLFNLLVLALDDMFYISGPILSQTDPGHQVAVLAIVLMNALLLVGLTYQSLKKQFVLAWDTLGILIVYVGTVIFMYMVHS